MNLAGTTEADWMLHRSGVWGLSWSLLIPVNTLDDAKHFIDNLAVLAGDGIPLPWRHRQGGWRLGYQFVPSGAWNDKQAQPAIPWTEPFLMLRLAICVGDTYNNNLSITQSN